MLELNGKEVKVNKDYLADLGIVKFPVTFKLVNRYRKFDAVNKRFQVPRSFGIPNMFSAYTDDGSQTFRYYKTKRPKQIGSQTIDSYYPLDTVLGSTGELVLDDKDMDLIAYLALHDRNATSPFKAEGKSMHFFTENKAKEAKAGADLFKKENKVNNLLLSLKNDKLVDIAKSYNVQGVDSMEPHEIQMAIRPFIKGKDNKDKDNKFNIFLDKVGSDGDVELLALINDAVEFNVIKHNKDAGKWYLLTQTGKEDESICEVRGGEDGINRLATYLLKFDDNDWRGYLRTKVEEVKLEASVKKEKAPKKETA